MEVQDAGGVGRLRLGGQVVDGVACDLAFFDDELGAEVLRGPVVGGGFACLGDALLEGGGGGEVSFGPEPEVP